MWVNDLESHILGIKITHMTGLRIGRAGRRTEESKKVVMWAAHDLLYSTTMNKKKGSERMDVWGTTSTTSSLYPRFLSGRERMCGAPPSTTSSLYPRFFAWKREDVWGHHHPLPHPLSTLRFFAWKREDVLGRHHPLPHPLSTLRFFHRRESMWDVHIHTLSTSFTAAW